MSAFHKLHKKFCFLSLLDFFFMAYSIKCLLSHIWFIAAHRTVLYFSNSCWVIVSVLGLCDNTKQEICPFPTGPQLPLNSSTSVGHSRGKWKLATVEKKEAEFQGNRDEWEARQCICMTYRKMQRPKWWQHQN